MPLTDAIIDYLVENRVSTTEVADVLGKTGELDSKMKPLVSRIRAVGRLFYAPSFNGSNWYTHHFLQEAPKNSVIYAEGVNCGEKAIFGSLVAKYGILYRRAKGIVVSGAVRDAHTLIKEQYPIWCWGVTPIGVINQDTGMDAEYYERRKKELEGAIVVADDSGVIVITQKQLTKAFLEGLARIELQEDIWFDCIDRLKYSTFETVCLRMYEK